MMHGMPQMLQLSVPTLDCLQKVSKFQEIAPTHSCLVDVPVVLHGSGGVVDPVQLAPDLHLLTLNLPAEVVQMN